MNEIIECTIVCGATLSHCTCTEPDGHEGPHVCGHDDGSWHYEDGQLRIDRLPNAAKALGLEVFPLDR